MTSGVMRLHGVHAQSRCRLHRQLMFAQALQQWQHMVAVMVVKRGDQEVQVQQHAPMGMVYALVHVMIGHMYACTSVSPVSNMQPSV